MTATTALSLGAELLRTGLLFLYALLFALVEIEIEGADGWAERLPTWYRVRPAYARLFGRLMNGKPLTGYHAVMFFIPLLSFHLGFAFGAPWSLDAEARVLATYLVWNVVWDFLWFLLNPHYGWARFRAGAIWWHGRWIGRFPVDYYNALLLSLLLAALPGLAGGARGVFYGHLFVTAGLAGLTALAARLAPHYMGWYRHMRRPGADERDLVLPATPPPSDGDGDPRLR